MRGFFDPSPTQKQPYFSSFLQPVESKNSLSVIKPKQPNFVHFKYLISSHFLHTQNSQYVYEYFYNYLVLLEHCIILIKLDRTRILATKLLLHMHKNSVVLNTVYYLLLIPIVLCQLCKATQSRCAFKTKSHHISIQIRLLLYYLSPSYYINYLPKQEPQSRHYIFVHKGRLML